MLPSGNLWVGQVPSYVSEEEGSSIPIAAVPAYK